MIDIRSTAFGRFSWMCCFATMPNALIHSFASFPVVAGLLLAQLTAMGLEGRLSRVEERLARVCRHISDVSAAVFDPDRHGPKIADVEGWPVFAWLDLKHGGRHEYVGTAKEEGGAFHLGQLREGEVLAIPGLIYRRAEA